MAEVTVAKENRPSIAKYVAYTALGLFLVNAFVAEFLHARSTVVAVGGFLLAGVVDLTIVFLMVQSLVEEWFAAAEVVDE